MGAYDYMDVGEYARLTDRSRQAVLKMVHNGRLSETGHDIVGIAPRRGKKRVVRWAIGVPREEPQPPR